MSRGGVTIVGFFAMHATVTHRNKSYNACFQNILMTTKVPFDVLRFVVNAWLSALTVGTSTSVMLPFLLACEHKLSSEAINFLIESHPPNDINAVFVQERRRLPRHYQVDTHTLTCNDPKRSIG